MKRSVPSRTRPWRLRQETSMNSAQRSAESRAKLLEAIADGLEGLGAPLLQRAHQETALPMARLTAERGRMTMQARLFAKVIRDETWLEARIDRAIPDRQPLPKPDVRRMMQPLGPVVVFGASNFPFAISVAGTDTVSALGAGCPVVVKAHPGHPGTSRDGRARHCGCGEEDRHAARRLLDAAGQEQLHRHGACEASADVRRGLHRLAQRWEGIV